MIELNRARVYISTDENSGTLLYGVNQCSEGESVVEVIVHHTDKSLVAAKRTASIGESTIIETVGYGDNPDSEVAKAEQRRRYNDLHKTAENELELSTFMPATELGVEQPGHVLMRKILLPGQPLWPKWNAPVKLGSRKS